MVNYVKVTNRKTFQHKIFPELNSKKHTPSPIPFDFYEIAELRKTIVAELRKTWVSQKRNREILREMTFANDCANCCFFAQNWCAKKEKFFVSFRKNCAKVLRMETLVRTREIPGYKTKLLINYHPYTQFLTFSLMYLRSWNRLLTGYPVNRLNLFSVNFYSWFTNAGLISCV